ncbi:hypothetical protein F7734_18105 [Scytonema sp. UIC 10036]|nr:hypothetical protein [Scytonema sp. UIC 10036]
MPCAVILTAIPLEYMAVRAHLTNLQEEMHPQGTIYEQGIFAGNGKVWQVGIVEIGAGNSTAAVEAERAIAYFNPNVIFFVGVAVGIKDVALGDVVAATKIYNYSLGKIKLEYEPKLDVGLSTYNLIHRARAEARKTDWLQRLKSSTNTSPRVFVAPIATGEMSNYGDAVAVEMEGRGLLQAAYANHQVSALIVRGISNLIFHEAEADVSCFQEIAARHASAFAFEILAKLDVQTNITSSQPVETQRDRRSLQLSHNDFEKYLGNIKVDIKEAIIKLYKIEPRLFLVIISGVGFPIEELRDNQSFRVTVQEFIDKCQGLTRINLYQIFNELYKENQGEPAFKKAVTLLGNNILPAPNAGLDQPFSTTAKPAFDLTQERTTYKWLPVDISTKFGLNRGSFIGIIVGEENDDVYKNLISVEQFLFDTNNNQSSLKIPTRWWIRIAVKLDSKIPKNQSQVWDEALVLESSNQLVEYLQSEGLPDAIILGIFIEVIQDLNQTLSEHLQNWCHALTNKIFDSSKVSIIIHIHHSDNIYHQQQKVINLVDRIAQKCLQIPIHTLILKSVYIHQCQQQGLIEKIGNSVTSNSRKETMEALRLACSQPDPIISDILMDSWFEASTLRNEHIPIGRELNVFLETTVNNLTWAILRQFPNHPEKVKNLIEGLKTSLLKPYLYICDFCLGKVEAESFLESAKDEQIALAVRAGIEIELPLLLENFQNIGLDRPIIAWVLMAVPPSIKYISELLTFNKEQRAVFGLCTREEHEQISSDSEIQEQILACQRYTI